MKDGNKLFTSEKKKFEFELNFFFLHMLQEVLAGKEGRKKL